MKDIYSMELHETLHDIDNPNGQGRFTVLRVPGGWIYTAYGDGMPSPVFVPFHNGFQKGAMA